LTKIFSDNLLTVQNLDKGSSCFFCPFPICHNTTVNVCCVYIHRGL